MQKMSIWLRVVLFSLILCLGTGVALWSGETASLALADLSVASVGALASPTQDDVLYAALNGEIAGIYRSDDEGSLWQMVSRGPETTIEALAIHPTDRNIIYAGTSSASDQTGGNLWYSDDGGQTWDRSKLVLPTNAEGQPPAVSALAVNPAQPGVVYVGTVGQGLYRFYVEQGRYDRIGGVTQQNLYVKDIVVGPDHQVYAVTTESLLRIRGNSGQKIALPDAAVSLAIHPASPQTLYIGTVGYGVYRSMDGGRSWQPINRGLNWRPGLILQVSAIAVDQEKPHHLTLATAYGVGSRWAGDGVYESFDAGQSWRKVGERQDVVEELTIKAGGIYAATARGLTRYGQPLPPTPSFWQPFRSLTSPSGMQLFILALTVLLAAWILIGRLAWWQGQTQETV
jgi:hypothetical protein